MKITWAQNPLETVIELDEHEQNVFWYKLKIENLVERLFSVHYEVDYKKDGPDMERVRMEVDPKHYLDEDEDAERPSVDRRTDQMFKYYMEALQSKHVGDCTCVACSCDKCHAESLLNIDTIKGLGKHQTYKIDNAFRDGRTMDEAIEYLKDYENRLRNPSEDTWARWKDKEAYFSYIPGWVEQSKAALKWLEQYRDEHFPKE